MAEKYDSQKINKSIETDLEMTEMVELSEKNMKTSPSHIIKLLNTSNEEKNVKEAR